MITKEEEKEFKKSKLSTIWALPLFMEVPIANWSFLSLFIFLLMYF